MSAARLAEIGVVIVSTADNAAGAYENPTPINVVTASGQAVSGVLSVVGPGATLATAPAAAVLTTGKITIDIQNGNPVAPGDILSLTGNTVAIIGAVGVALGAPVTVPVMIGGALAMLGVSINQGWIPWFGYNNQFSQAKGWQPPRDPIILDLDGNGLQTVGLASNIYFDHNCDGILSKTGWVGEGDALLVWDRNSNGLIDNGAELFGDFTPMPDGTQAPNGFAALAALDTNGDGVLDATDPAFTELKLWIDNDQNGVTGEGELISLAAAGIASLNLGNTLKNQSQGNGNTLAREGSFTRIDGTESAMGEFHLAIDTSDSFFIDEIEVPESISGLPNMFGSGNVRDLRQAAVQSSSLELLLSQFQQSSNRDEQKALVDQILTRWANTSGMATSLDSRAKGEFRIEYEAFGNVREFLLAA